MSGALSYCRILVFFIVRVRIIHIKFIFHGKHGIEFVVTVVAVYSLFEAVHVTQVFLDLLCQLQFKRVVHRSFLPQPLDDVESLDLC